MVLPVCDHYSGVEVRMRKSLQLQAEMTQEFGACVFDVTLDCEDGAPVGGEIEHAHLVKEIALSAATEARVAVRIHPVDHPSFADDISLILTHCHASLKHVMVPKVESIQDVETALKFIDQVGANLKLPAHVMRMAKFLRTVWSQNSAIYKPSKQRPPKLLENLDSPECGAFTPVKLDLWLKLWHPLYLKLNKLQN